MASKKRSKFDISVAWYNAPEDGYTAADTTHGRLFAHVRSLEQDQCDIHYQNILNARLYSNRDVMALDWNGNTSISFRPLSSNLENVIASVIDTKVALIGKNRPKATPVSRASDFDVYLRTRQLDRFLYGEFLCHKVWLKTNQCYLDAQVYGTGVVKIDIDKTERDVYVERVNPDEIVVDQRECISSDMPSQLFHRKLVSRLWLLETYGDDPVVKEAILEAQTNDFQYTSYRNPDADSVIVIEAWKLPSKPGASDGVHAICIENCTLLCESYSRNKYPFCFYKPKPPMSGFYGRSTVEGLMDYQIRLNKLNRDIEHGQDAMCRPRVFLQQGSSVAKVQLDNSIGKIITVQGDLPQAQTWTAFSPEIYNERDRIKQSAYQAEGVSELSSQAKLPTQARLDSSEALREFNAIENERFSREAMLFEDFHIEIAEHLVECYAELYKNLKVNKKQFYRNRYLIQQINWKDINLEADEYIFQISASSILNMTPAARKDKLNEWASAGVISLDQYKAYSGEPDLERLADILSAPYDYAEYVVEKMLSGEPQSPDPLSNVELTLDVVSKTYLHLRAIDAPEDILQFFRDYMLMSKDILAPTPAPMAASAPMPGEVPAGAPVDAMGMPVGPAGAGLPQPPMQPINTVTGAPAPSISSPAASAFLG